MAITTSLTPGDMPRVLIVIPGADIPASAAWALTGSGAGLLWTVRGGSGTGTGVQVALVDHFAPVNVTITYTLTVAGTVSDTDTIVRRWTGTGGDGRGADVFADLMSNTIACVRRLPGDIRHTQRRFHAVSVPGNPYSPLRLGPVAGKGGGSFTVAAVGAHADNMGALLDSNEILIYFHDTSRCDLPGCPIPAVTMLYVTSEISDVGARQDIGERQWSLSWIAQEDPEPDYAAPLSTWDEFDVAWASPSDWDDFDAAWAADDWGAFDITAWTTVGA